MTSSEIAGLLPGTKRTFKASYPIIYQGEIPRCGFFIKKGLVKVFTLQNTGEEQIVGFFKEGDFFPLPWLYGNIKTSIYYYEAAELTETISVLKEDVEKIAKSNPTLTEYIFKQLLDEQTTNQLRITSLEQPRAQEKLLFTLYYFIHSFGTTKDEKHYDVTISLTHSTIASLVGITRETTAVEMNKLKAKGVLDYKNKKYSINRPKLEEAMNEDSFSSIL